MSAAKSTPGPLDVGPIRDLVQQLNERYLAALQYAYCPSSEPYRRCMRRVSETNAALEAYIAAIAKATGSAALAKAGSDGEGGLKP